MKIGNVKIGLKGWRPYTLCYTDKFVPERFGGIVYGLFIFIRPKHRDNTGLLEHELIHVEQFYRPKSILMLRYKFSKSYRLKCEVEGYKKQIQYYDSDQVERLLRVFAGYIATKYKLDITQEDAYNLLVN